eukprot:TRINITY_DN70923_c0_g1_i1.p1 TRINITY_DN70923_c0_g1~~TRINITY_DN70923_c0_g1_i1.p1  ORF type:complete len:394 (-),score=58.07 TRINITY_DN70923_c0_g1_i1:139-1320(-)
MTSARRDVGSEPSAKWGWLEGAGTKLELSAPYSPLLGKLEAKNPGMQRALIQFARWQETCGNSAGAAGLPACMTHRSHAITSKCVIDNREMSDTSLSHDLMQTADAALSIELSKRHAGQASHRRIRSGRRTVESQPHAGGLQSSEHGIRPSSPEREVQTARGLDRTRTMSHVSSAGVQSAMQAEDTRPETPMGLDLKPLREKRSCYHRSDGVREVLFHPQPPAPFKDRVRSNVEGKAKGERMTQMARSSSDSAGRLCKSTRQGETASDVFKPPSRNSSCQRSRRAEIEDTSQPEAASKSQRTSMTSDRSSQSKRQSSAAPEATSQSEKLSAPASGGSDRSPKRSYSASARFHSMSPVKSSEPAGARVPVPSASIAPPSRPKFGKPAKPGKPWR